MFSLTEYNKPEKSQLSGSGSSAQEGAPCPGKNVLEVPCSLGEHV